MAGGFVQNQNVGPLVQRSRQQQALLLATGAEITREDLFGARANDAAPAPGIDIPDGMSFRDAKARLVESFEREFLVEALRRRARDGGSYHVHVNLARAAMWYASLGTFESKEFEVTDENGMIEPRTVTFASPYGEVYRLAPMVQLARTPGRWREPLLPFRTSAS